MKKGHSGNVELAEETGDVWKNIEMVSGLSPVSISSTFLGETGDGCKQAGKTEKVSRISPVSPRNVELMETGDNPETISCFPRFVFGSGT